MSGRAASAAKAMRQAPPVLGLVALLWAGAAVQAQSAGSDSALPASSAADFDTVRVAPPTGDDATDRANVQAAFDAVQPGGTVLFAPGTYLLGAGARLTVPDVTVLGHPEGTVLRGCNPEAFAPDTPQMEIVFGCTGLYVEAERQTIRGLTFEYTWHGIVVGPFPASAAEAAALGESGERLPLYPAGGQRIEGNTFRNTPNGLRVLGIGNERSVVRDNDFIDVFHAIGIYGAPLHFLDNRLTAAEPDRVPFSRHPGSAIIVSPGHTDCAGHVVAGNRIEGYPDPIYVHVDRGETCRGVEIRDNTIHATRVRLPDVGGYTEYRPTEDDSTMVGVPITLMNRTEPRPGGPEADAEGVLEDILVQGNQILGAEGLGILIQDVSRSRIAGNTIVGIERRDPFPGITWDGFEPRWEAANGSAIWVSPGSDENQIVGNIFQDVAGAAVFLEGQDNVVELLSASDSVRDLGTGNRVSEPGAGAGSQVRGAEAAPWTDEDLQRRAALIYVQHVAFSLTGAREDGVAAAEQGHRIGEIVARYKQRLTWHTSSNALLANALAKLIEPEYELDFGRATFTLRSRYQRAARELARYGSSIEEYVEWLQAMHDAIGPVQGYAMTARLEGDWLVETYRDLPNRKDLEPATDLPLYELSAEELRRYEGVYTGTRARDTASVEFTMRVWQEDGRLRVTTWRTGQREPYGRHLLPVAADVFLPGWDPSDGPVEVLRNARVRFSPTDAGPAEWVEVEVEVEDETVLWRLTRVW